MQQCDLMTQQGTGDAPKHMAPSVQLQGAVVSTCVCVVCVGWLHGCVYVMCVHACVHTPRMAYVQLREQ